MSSPPAEVSEHAVLKRQPHRPLSALMLSEEQVVIFDND